MGKFVRFSLKQVRWNVQEYQPPCSTDLKLCPLKRAKRGHVMDTWCRRAQSAVDYRLPRGCNWRSSCLALQSTPFKLWPRNGIVRQVFITHIENNICVRNILLRTSLFWAITQRVVVILCLGFGTTCRFRNVGKELLLLLLLLAT